MDDLARQLKDKKQYDLITRGWRDFFAGKYKRIVDEARPPHP